MRTTAREVAQRFRLLFAQQRRDLPVFALIQLALLLVFIALNKYLAVAQAYAAQRMEVRLGVLWRSLGYDFLILAALTLLVFISRNFTLQRPRFRTFVFVFIYLATLAACAATFVNREFFMYLGAPLNRQLIALAPSVGPALIFSVQDLGMIVLCAILLAVAHAAGMPLIFNYTRPLLLRGERWGVRPWIFLLALCAACAASLSRPVFGTRDLALRSMTLAHLFLAGESSKSADVKPLTQIENQELSRIVGPARTDGLQAFAGIPRRPRNVVVWVWETVGERYLHSYHPLGEAQTPNLDRIAAHGAVRFSNCYAQCPLSVQTGWAILSGNPPPGKPAIFTQDGPLPAHSIMLPQAMKTGGYHTAQFNAGLLNFWGDGRIFDAAGFDVVKDGVALMSLTSPQSGKKYVQIGWGADSTAMTAAGLTWIDTLPQKEPFFVLLWGMESHSPYLWEGMPDAVRALDNYQRYLKCIEHSDDVLGAFYDDLERRGLNQDTLWVIVGDHGEGFGRPPRPYDRAHSMRVFEDAVNVPLLFIHPDLKKSSTVLDTPCTHMDLFPTIVDLCGLPQPQQIEGASLAANYQPRPLFLRSMQWWPAAIRAGEYKLILDQSDDRPQVFDLSKDTTEANDISEQQPMLTQTLLHALLLESATRARTDPSLAPLRHD